MFLIYGSTFLNRLKMNILLMEIEALNKSRIMSLFLKTRRKKYMKIVFLARKKIYLEEMTI